MVSAREIPYVKIMLPLIMGIIIGYYTAVPIVFTITSGLLFFLSISITAFLPLTPYQRNRLAFLPYCFFLLLGIFLIDRSEKNNAIPEYLVGEKQALLVEVDQLPKYGSRIQIRANIKGFAQEEKLQAGSFGALHISLEKKESSVKIQKGDQLFIRGKILPVKGPKNPNAFNFKAFLISQGIHHSAYIPDDAWEIIKANDQFSIYNLAQAIQQKFVHLFNLYIPAEREAAVVNALVLGSKSDLNPEIRDAYANTGALHVLAVSGLHVGMIYGFILLLLKKIRRRSKWIPWLRFLVPLSAVWIFAFISGASPSVVRASIMLSLLLISQLLQRYPSIYNTMAFTAFIMLVINPWQLFNISFQLSFMALLSIIYFQPKIYSSWYIKNWLGDKIWMLVSVGIAAQIGTFPLALYYFHQFPIYFWLSGIIVVPFAFLILGLGILLLLTHFILPFLSISIGKMLSAVVWLMNALIYAIQEIPFALYEGIWIKPWQVFLLYFIILLFLFAFRLKNKKLLFSALLVSLSFSLFLLLHKINLGPNHKIIIYHSYGNSRIDYFLGSTNYAFTSESFDPDKLNQLIEPVHKFNRIKKQIFQLPNKFRDNNIPGMTFYSINENKFALASHDLDLSYIEKISIDYLILSGNPKIDAMTLLKKVEAKNIIIDSSNHGWYIKKITHGIAELNKKPKLFNIPQNGAFIIDFNKNTIGHFDGKQLNL